MADYPVTNPIPILHVINECNDDSITRIIERIIRFSDRSRYRWYICALRGVFEFGDDLSGLGARVIDGSSAKNDGRSASDIIKEIISIEGIKIVHSHTPRGITATWQALRNFKDHHRPTHIATKHLLTSPRDRKLGLIYSIYDRVTLYMVDWLIAVSERMADQIKRHPGISSSKVLAIPNSIPVEVFYRPDLRESNRSKMNLAADSSVVGFTGRIEKVKRLDLLLEAFTRLVPAHPHLRLAVAGEGSLFTDLRNLAHRLGVDNLVTWTGFCNDIPGFLSAIDIYVQPSNNEGMSLSILEAMAAGKPVVVTRVGSAEEIIRDRENGILIPQGDANAVAGAIKFLLENSIEADRLAQNGRSKAKNEFDIQKMVDRYTDFYMRLQDIRGK